MTTTAYGVNAPEAQKLWRKRTFDEALKATWFGKFMGDSEDSVLQMLDETKKAAGDRITSTLIMQMTGDGVVGDGTLEGNEEALLSYTDNLTIDQLRHAHRTAGKMTEQRIPWDIREKGQRRLSDWFAGRYDQILFNHLCGYTVETRAAYIGANAIVAPDTAHVYRPNSRATDQALTTGDEFSLSFLDEAVAIAKLATPVIRPVKVNGNDKYVAVLHTYQVKQMRTNTGTGQWLDIQKAAVTGDGSSGNPIYTGALGEYNGVVIHESTRITAGVHSTTGAAVSNTRRGILMGAQAGVIAFGRGDSADEMDWNEELFDYGNQLGVSAGAVFGLKKSRFNSADFGVVTMGSYTA